MRVLSFQSKSVLDTLEKESIYKPFFELSREKNDYESDIIQLGGCYPIWCFAPCNTDKFSLSDFTDGSLLERFRCEMSLQQDNGLSNFILLEIEVNKSKLFTGKSHNSYSGAKVFSTLSKDMIKAVYKVEDTTHFYFKNIRLLESYTNDILFPDGLRTVKRIVNKGIAYESYTDGMFSKRSNYYAYADAINLEKVTVAKVTYDGNYTVISDAGNIAQVDTVFVKIDQESMNMF